ncbi:MAG: hypothetical protein K9J85_03480 [Desulfobacteraceae bacterium]|nr:hypothetical protein [Desulfobacteraceae bacterium]
MKLLDEIVEVDAQKAVARSVTTDKWPLAEQDGILPVVVVELVAQTAGINIRWEEFREAGGREKEGGGLLVGVKEAVFHVKRIPLDATIITCAAKKYAYMNYAVYQGFSQIGEQILGRAMIQVLRTDE